MDYTQATPFNLKQSLSTLPLYLHWTQLGGVDNWAQDWEFIIHQWWSSTHQPTENRIIPKYMDRAWGTASHATITALTFYRLHIGNAMKSPHGSCYLACAQPVPNTDIFRVSQLVSHPWCVTRWPWSHEMTPLEWSFCESIPRLYLLQ